MHQDQQRNNIAFHNRAADALKGLFKQFKASTATINRQRDEHVFQQQVAKYSNQLKHNLEGIALEMLGKSYPGTSHDEWSQGLNQFIGNYVLEFKQKAQSL